MRKKRYDSCPISVIIVQNSALCPEAVATAPVPPSKAATRPPALLRLGWIFDCRCVRPVRDYIKRQHGHCP